MEPPESTEAPELPEGATKPVSVKGSKSGSQASSAGSNGMFNIHVVLYYESDFPLPL